MIAEASPVNVLVSRSTVATDDALAAEKFEGNCEGKNQVEDLTTTVFKEGSPALKALEQTYLFCEGLIMR